MAVSPRFREMVMSIRRIESVFWAVVLLAMILVAARNVGAGETMTPVLSLNEAMAAQCRDAHCWAIRALR